MCRWCCDAAIVSWRLSDCNVAARIASSRRADLEAGGGDTESIGVADGRTYHHGCAARTPLPISRAVGKGRIIDQIWAVAGWHRKHVVWAAMSQLQPECLGGCIEELFSRLFSSVKVLFAMPGVALLACELEGLPWTTAHHAKLKSMPPVRATPSSIKCMLGSVCCVDLKEDAADAASAGAYALGPSFFS